VKKGKDILVIILALLVLIPSYPAVAQSGYKEKNGQYMAYIVEGNDTVYLSPLAAAHVYERKKRNKGREWRKYYRLVYNFAKVYPYALVAKEIVFEADSTIKEDNLKYIRKDKYVGAITSGLFKTFEKPLRNLTINQGQLLMKLIDRECGVSSYSIIKDFKNRYAAGFWQGIAKLFGSDLKKHYDPFGEDAATEELVRQWEEGKFEQTYYEIFWEYPPVVDIPDKYKSHRKAVPRTQG